MTEQVKHVCSELCSHAKTKKEVFEAMKALYPNYKDGSVNSMISECWKTRILPKKILLQGLKPKQIAEKIKEAISQYEENVECLGVYLHLNKRTASIEKPLYYLLLKGRNEPNGVGKIRAEYPGRTALLGQRVMLVSIEENMVRVEHKNHGIFCFTLFDINKKFSMEIEYKKK